MIVINKKKFKLIFILIFTNKNYGEKKILDYIIRRSYGWKNITFDYVL